MRVTESGGELAPLMDRAELIDNPYWEYLQRNVPHTERLNFKNRGVYTPDTYDMNDQGFKARTELTREYSWAIPSPQALAFTLLHLDGRSVVEMGAGAGYWAWMLQQLGVDVMAYDLHPPDQDENWYHSAIESHDTVYTDQDVARFAEAWGLDSTVMTELEKQAGLRPALPEVGSPRVIQRAVPGHRREVFHPIEAGGPESLAAHPDRVLFLCWPPYDDTMAAEALLNYTGDTVIYVGEGPGGCTGDDLFFHLLEKGWDERAWLYEHVQWSGIRDHIFVYSRKPQP